MHVRIDRGHRRAGVDEQALDHVLRHPGLDQPGVSECLNWWRGTCTARPVSSCRPMRCCQTANARRSVSYAPAGPGRSVTGTATPTRPDGTAQSRAAVRGSRLAPGVKRQQVLGGHLRRDEPQACQPALSVTTGLTVISKTRIR